MAQDADGDKKKPPIVMAYGRCAVCRLYAIVRNGICLCCRAGYVQNWQ